MPSDFDFMRQALALARRGFGHTSPNPMVGAVLVREGVVIGKGWHHRAKGAAVFGPHVFGSQVDCHAHENQVLLARFYFHAKDLADRGVRGEE